MYLEPLHRRCKTIPKLKPRCVFHHCPHVAERCGSLWWRRGVTRATTGLGSFVPAFADWAASTVWAKIVCHHGHVSLRAYQVAARPCRHCLHNGERNEDISNFLLVTWRRQPPGRYRVGFLWAPYFSKPYVSQPPRLAAKRTVLVAVQQAPLSCTIISLDR